VNYLAHILLSGHDQQWQLGGYLGDFIKGPLPAVDQLGVSPQGFALPVLPTQSRSPHLLDAEGKPWSQQVLQGVVLHRRIDAYTDAHEDYKRCLALLGPRFRRFAPIALDVFVDHLLALHWREYHDSSLEQYCDDFYSFCVHRSACLPVAAAEFIARAAQYRLFSSYARWEVFEQVLSRIDQRIRFDSNLVEVGFEIRKHYQSLEAILLPFIATAKAYAEDWRAQRALG